MVKTETQGITTRRIPLLRLQENTSREMGQHALFAKAESTRQVGPTAKTKFMTVRTPTLVLQDNVRNDEGFPASICSLALYFVRFSVWPMWRYVPHGRAYNIPPPNSRNKLATEQNKNEQSSMRN